MRSENAKNDPQFIFRLVFRGIFKTLFKLFSSFVISFTQLGKEGHTSSLVQSLSASFMQRSLCCFTRILGKNAWAVEEVMAVALHRFFHTLRIKSHPHFFLIMDDTIIEKKGKKIPGCSWYKDHS